VNPTAAYEDDRAYRRDRACVVTGLLLGACVGAIAATLAPPNTAILAFTGAAIGAVSGRLIAFRIAVEEWDPPPNRRPFVGANSPEDDISG
jgi:hypothetical protein